MDLVKVIEKENIKMTFKGVVDEIYEAASIHEAVKIYFFQKLARMGAVEEIQKKCAPCPELQEFIDFVLTTKRGITSGRPLKEKTP